MPVEEPTAGSRMASESSRTPEQPADKRGRGRRVVTMWVIGCLALASVAAGTGLGGPVPALAFRQAGHWVYNRSLGAVFHINGASKDVDATASVPGAGRGSQVLQGDRQGFVVDNSHRRVVIFGKSTLTVDSRLSVGANEEPVGLEVRGGPYLVYQVGGKIIRLGQPPVTVNAGGPLGNPVTTTDGTVWVQRTDTGALCKLLRAHNRLSCPASAPGNHPGALTAIDDRPAFVDTVADTVAPITSNGLGKASPLGVDVPSDAEVAGSDAGGRLPILTHGAGQQQGSVLTLVDTSMVGTGKAGVAPIKVPLGAGRFGAPATSGGAVAVVDRTAGKVVTFNNRGVPKATKAVPAGSGDIRLSRGEDGRVYADDADGAHTLVVDGDGSVTPVSVGGKDIPPPSAAPSVGPPATSPNPTTVPPAAPGAPRGVEAVAGDRQARVTWSPAADNGSAITSYRVAWRAVSGAARSGSFTTPAGRRRVTVSGLVNGVTYVVTVSAQNQVGTGPGADSAPVTPSVQEATAPSGVQATATPDGAVAVSWRAGAGAVRYSVVANGSDGATRTVARSSSTQTVATGLSLGVRWRFTVTATDADGQVSSPATSAGVTAFMRAGAPGGLTATRGKATVGLSWTAPNLNGGRFASYHVSATGRPDQTVTGTSTQFTGLTNGTVYHFAVRAVTRDPNTGAAVDGSAATVAATPATAPTVTIVSVRWVGHGLAGVRVSVDDGGNSPVTCHIFVDVIARLSHSCTNGRELVLTGLQDDTDYTLQSSGSNSIGTGPTTKIFGLPAHDPGDQWHFDVAHGTPIRDGSCNPASCAFVFTALYGLKSNATYDITCRSSSSPDGFASFNLVTDDLGYASAERCRYAKPGDDVWATAASGIIPSNHIRW
jgi:hypothetical protein